LAEETASAIVQLAQPLASGVLQGDELKSVVENMPLLAEALARELGAPSARCASSACMASSPLSGSSRPRCAPPSGSGRSCLGVDRVRLAALNIWLHVGRRHKPDLMTELGIVNLKHDAMSFRNFSALAPPMG
jgi:tape measure domain-containing protein